MSKKTRVPNLVMTMIIFLYLIRMIILIDTTSCTWKCTLRSLKHYKMLCTAVQDNNDSNSRMKLQLVKPQTQDQSNNILKTILSNVSQKFSKSSNVQQLHSHHSVHIKHNGTRFQTKEDCLPNQLHHPNKRSVTISGNTHESPNVQKTKLHNLNAKLQHSKRCSTVSPLQQHIQVRIFPHSTVPSKKENLLGAFTHQMHFQGKLFAQGPLKES